MKDYSKTIKILKILGFVLLPVGVICLLIGFIDFFKAFSSTQPPKLFFMCFIGTPLSFGGVVCLIIGYRKEITGFAASQVAPVTKDVTNYIIDGTRDNISKTIKQASENTICCSHCGCDNSSDSSFCKKCGKPLTIVCKKCKTENSQDATYCKKCGEKL